MDDTDPKMVAIQRDLLRKAGLEKRAALVRSLSSSVIELSRRELRARSPFASEEDLAVEWVARNYGPELARRLRSYLTTRNG